MPQPLSIDKRVRYLEKLDLLDSLPEEAYDAITELAAYICGTPISLVSLLDEDRQFFKSRYGLGVSETPIEYSFCNHAIQKPDEPFIVENAAEDDRFRDNPLVTDNPKIRFYAGIPLLTRNKIPLGTLCVIDRQPRDLSTDQLRALKNLAIQVTQLLEFRQSEIEKKKAIQRLHESEDFLRRLVRELPCIFYLFDQQGQMILWNDLLRQYSEYSDEEIVRMRPAAFYDEQSQSKVEQGIEQVFRDGEAQLEADVSTKSGRMIPFLLKAAQINYKGETCLFGVGIDISLIREAERELAQSEHKFRSLVQDGGDLIGILDPEGVYSYVSPTSTSVLGIEPEEFIGKVAFDFIHPEDRPGVQEQFGRLETERQVSIRPFRFHNKKGEWRWIETIATNMLDDPAIEGIVVNSRDVTEYKRTHMELQELNDELARSNAELEQFAYVASHDLQEPLRMVSSFMTLLEKKYGDLLDEKAHEYIHYATDGAKRMKKIIVDLLDYSKAGRNQEPPAPVDLNQLLRDYQELRRQRIAESGATIEFNDFMPVVAREAPLLQTLHSLLDNAIKYVHPDHTPRIQVTVQESDSEWTISIIDNGIGIDPEYHDKIFILFQRLHLNEEYEGTGIGLAVAKKQVESWGGDLRVQSREGEGSTFSFTIPKPNPPTDLVSDG